MPLSAFTSTRPAALFALPLALAVAGCGSEEGTAYTDSEVGAGDADAVAEVHHHDDGPHDGHVIEFAGDHSVHGELVVAGGTATLYMYGSDFDTPLDAEKVVFEMDDESEGGMTSLDFTGSGIADPADAEPSAEWQLTDAAVPAGGVEEMEGTFYVTIDDEVYEGRLEHGDHDHEGHDADGAMHVDGDDELVTEGEL